MCYLCDESDDGSMASCQDCGRSICWDVTFGDDIVRPAHGTSSGDLYCDWCGSAHDRAEEEEYEDDDIDEVFPL